MSRNRIRWLLTFSAIILLSAMALVASSAAQENRATIVGTVTDQQGNVIPNASIKATNIETNAATTTTSNEAGLYTLPFLPVGKYQISVSANGLKKARHDGVELRVGDRVHLEIRMEVGEVSETVTVTGQTPLMETATASRGQVIEEANVTRFPLVQTSIVPVQETTNTPDGWKVVELLPKGERLEIELKTGERTKGKLASVSKTDLSISEKGRTTTLSRDDVLRVYQVIGRTRGKSALRGTGIGGAIGFGLGLILYLPGRPDPAIDGVGVPILGALGAAMGASIGTAFGGGQKRVLIYQAG
jgi:Carboxypeptidase regulatory-like domain